MARGNKAHRDAFVSIQAETKEMLRHIIPAVQHMPKYDRVEGLGAELKNAVKGILIEYHIARHCPTNKEYHIEKMIGYFYLVMDMMELCCLFGIMRDEYKLPIAMRMERIEEGINIWYNSVARQARGQSTQKPSDPGSD